MNGAGFKCDQCGKAVIIQGAFSGSFGPGPHPPAGWTVVSGPMPTDTTASTDVRHFCSVVCVAGWAHAVIAPAVPT